MSSAEIAPVAQDAGGTIHDIGYRRYEGRRMGRGHAALALYLYSLRSAFGLGRAARAKIFPFTLAGIMLVTGVVDAAIKAKFNISLFGYLDLPNRLGFVLVLFLASVGPELLSRDLRNKVLPLYFSRPIGRDDYVLAKLAAMVTGVTILLGLPMLAMFLGGAFNAGTLNGAFSEFSQFLSGLLFALINAIVLSCLALLIASLSSRRTIAAGGIVAVFIVTTPVSAALRALGSASVKHASGLVSPFGLMNGIRTWLFGADSAAGPLDIGGFGVLYLLLALVIAAGGTALLVYRYRRTAA